MAFKATTKDGETVEWASLKVCLCDKCGVLFNSVSAFDAHITGPADDRVHDYSWMPRNNRGYLVTELRKGHGLSEQK